MRLEGLRHFTKPGDMAWINEAWGALPHFAEPGGMEDFARGVVSLYGQVAVKDAWGMCPTYKGKGVEHGSLRFGVVAPLSKARGVGMEQ